MTIEFAAFIGMGLIALLAVAVLWVVLRGKTRRASLKARIREVELVSIPLNLHAKGRKPH